MTPDKTPSIYPRRECKELPGWIAFDKQILTFDAYFQEAMWEVDKCPFQIRKVKIYFYPEDGTIQVNEPRVDNSGMAQGNYKFFILKMKENIVFLYVGKYF